MAVQVPSRPFRWFGLLIAGWICLRTLTILSGDPFGSTLDVAPKTIAAGHRMASRSATPPTTALAAKNSAVRPVFAPPRVRFHAPEQPTLPGSRGNSPVQVAPNPAASLPRIFSEPSTMGQLPQVTAGGWSRPNSAKRWSASAWLLVRSDGPVPLGSGGELGGSQAGARLFYDIASPVAVTARVSRPLARPRGGEASVGVALRHRNVGLLLERRIALDDGGRNDFSVTAYGGVSEIPLDYGIRLDGYAQAGIVGSDGFADGAVRIERTIATVGKARVSAGAGAWGGIQPGARRVDVGPQIVAQIPVEGNTVRISAEWRERVAGDAAPRSGPSLSIGVDF